MTVVAEMLKEDLTDRLDTIIELLQNKSNTKSGSLCSSEDYAKLVTLMADYGAACISTRVVSGNDASFKNLMNHIMSMLARK